MINTIRRLPLSKQAIIARAEALFLRYAKLVGHDFAIGGVNFDHIFENFIYPTYGIELIENEDLGFDEQGEKIFGLFQPVRNRAYIDSSLKDDPHRIFTCWHEVGGHGVLQGKWLKDEIRRIGDLRQIVTTEPMLTSSVENSLEWQANLFAAHSAAPSGFVDHVIERTLKLSGPIKYQGPNYHTFDVGGRTRIKYISDFRDLCGIVAYYIRHRFGGLSKESLSIRVAGSKWVIDLTQRNDLLSEFSLKRTSTKFKKQSQEICPQKSEILQPV